MIIEDFDNEDVFKTLAPSLAKQINPKVIQKRIARRLPNFTPQFTYEIEDNTVFVKPMSSTDTKRMTLITNIPKETKLKDIVNLIVKVLVDKQSWQYTQSNFDILIINNQIRFAKENKLNMLWSDTKEKAKNKNVYEHCKLLNQDTAPKPQRYLLFEDEI